MYSLGVLGVCYPEDAQTRYGKEAVKFGKIG